MRILSLVLIAATICWPVMVFSQSEEKPADNRSMQSSQETTMSENSQSQDQNQFATNSDSQSQEQEPPLVVRVYEIGDLALAGLYSYPAIKLIDLDYSLTTYRVNSMGVDPYLSDQILFPGSTPRYTVPRAGSLISDRELWGNQEINDEIIETITSVIAPDSWECLGNTAKIKAIGDMLVVSTTEKNHTEIRSMLDQLRQNIALRKTVVVETHWLWLTEAQLHGLVPKSSGNVDENAWDEHQKLLAREDSEFPPGYHAAISCLNGQRVSAVAGRQRRFVISLIPVVGDDGSPPAIPIQPTPSGSNGRSVGYEAQVSTVQEGAALQVRPILCGEEQVLLDIHGRVVALETLDQRENDSDEESPKDSGASNIREVAKAVDRPVVNTSRIDTTLRAPLDARVLVGGITGTSLPEPGEPNLYLFVKATVRKSSNQTSTKK